MNNRVFTIARGLLKVVSDGSNIPESEPVFVLRARDTQALSTIRVYQSTMPPKSEGWRIIQAVIDDFTTFLRENRDKMGSPNEVY